MSPVIDPVQLTRELVQPRRVAEPPPPTRLAGPGVLFRTRGPVAGRGGLDVDLGHGAAFAGDAELCAAPEDPAKPQTVKRRRWIIRTEPPARPRPNRIMAHSVSVGTGVGLVVNWARK